jgi:hypothetical protein
MHIPVELIVKDVVVSIEEDVIPMSSRKGCTLVELPSVKVPIGMEPSVRTAHIGEATIRDSRWIPKVAIQDLGSFLE